MLAMVLMQELGFEPGHVDVGGTLALARLAFEAQVEHVVDGGIGESFETELAGDREPKQVGTARACCPSRRGSPGTKGTSSPRRFLRQAPTPAHSSAAGSRPPSAEKSNVVGTAGVT